MRQNPTAGPAPILEQVQAAFYGDDYVDEIKADADSSRRRAQFADKCRTVQITAITAGIVAAVLCAVAILARVTVFVWML